MRVNLGTYENQEAILNKQTDMINKQTDLINKQVNLGTKVNQTTIIKNQTTMIQNQKEIKSLLEFNNIIEDTHIVSVLLSNANELSIKWALKSDRVGNAFYLIAKNEGVVAEELKGKKFTDIISSSAIMNKVVNSVTLIEIMAISPLNKEVFSSNTVLTALRNSKKTKKMYYKTAGTLNGRFLPLISNVRGINGPYTVKSASGSSMVGENLGYWLLKNLDDPIAINLTANDTNSWVECYDFNA